MTIFVLWIQEMRWLEVVNKIFIIHNLKRAFICNKNRENASLSDFILSHITAAISAGSLTKITQ